MKLQLIKLFLLLSFSTIIYNCSSNKSVVGIPSNETFILGETQNASFKATLTNQSDKDVKLKIVNTKTGKQTQGFGLGPKGEAEIYVSSKETAKLINNNDVEINVKVVFNKPVSGMRYVKNNQENQAVVSVPSKQTFLLGEKESAAFNVNLTNFTDKKIELVVIETLSKKVQNQLFLAAKETKQLSVGENNTLKIINDFKEEIKVKAILNKTVEGMRYINNVSEVRYLKRDSLVQDLDLLEKALTTMHPGIYRYNSPSQIQNYFKNLKASLPNYISEKEFIINLAQLTAKIKCGHTYLNPWNLNKEVRERVYSGKKFIPLGFEIINGKYYLTENVSENKDIKRGAELLSINGFTIDEIHSKLKTIAKSDGNNSSPYDSYLSVNNYQDSHWEAFDIYFPLFFPLEEESFKITYKNIDEVSVKEASLSALEKKERAEKIKAKYGDDILNNKKWSYTVVDNIGIIKLGTFSIWNWKDFDQKKWFADTFKKINEQNINSLIIDIRGNGGGLSEPSHELMSYLTNETIDCNNDSKVYIRTVKFDKELMPYIDSWVEPLKVGLPNEYYKNGINGLFEFLEPNGCKEIQPNKNNFTGKTYIFGNSTNVSATFTLLNNAKKYNFAEYIGSTSGGNLQGINGGEYAFFTMPYCNLEVDIPLKYFYNGPNKLDKGLKPDVEVKRNQESIAYNTDPLFEYVRSKK